MSWNGYATRRVAIESVLEHAHRHPEGGLPYTQLPQAAAEFRTRNELLLALQDEWSQALLAQIELLSIDTRTGRRADARELARRAWRKTVQQHQTLRRLLDDYLVECGTKMDVALHRQDDLLVSAGIGHSAQSPQYGCSHVA